jgi:opacity protein-like surface antigen
MKKAFILAACLLVASIATKAQTYKMWLSGTASMSSTNDKFGGTTDKSSTGVFGPVFGYNVNSNITVGLGLKYSSDVNDPDGPGKTTTTGFSISPFARYYKSAGEHVSIYGAAWVSIVSGKIKQEGQTNDFKTSGFGVGIAPGIQYWFSDRWSINGEWGILSYGTSKVKDSNPEQKSDTFKFGLDLSAFTVGLNYHFVKK